MRIDMPGSPFDLDNPAAYARWRDWKLAHVPRTAAEIVVEVNDPAALSPTEHEAILACVRRSNMAICAGRLQRTDKEAARAIGRQFGLVHLDANWLADDDGISEIRVHQGGTRSDFIPYTDRPIKWHTDGYYNPPERRIRAMVLHCVRSAAQGGENQLLDHELAYLLLREKDPDYIRTLMQPDVMTIPERMDAQDGIRPAQTGPVFSLDENGALHMRYTARTRSIVWKQDAATQAAVAALEKVLSADAPHVLHVRLESGMGLLCNNVLHDRAAFGDDPAHPRLLYRARYYDRIAGAECDWSSHVSGK
jgi:Taurine catabolism dioxygenase TauD, TfdA family